MTTITASFNVKGEEALTSLSPDVPQTNETASTHDTIIESESTEVKENLVPEDGTDERGEAGTEENRIHSSFHISIADNDVVNSYPHFTEINDIDKMSKAVKLAHCSSRFEDKYDRKGGKIRGFRSRKTFGGADTIIMKVDNTEHAPTEEELKPEEYIRPDDVAEAFAGVEAYVVYDPGNVRQIEDICISKAFNVYFPIKQVGSPNAYVTIAEKLHDFFPAFTTDSADECRVISGIENPKVKHFNGSTTVTEFLLDYYPVPDSIPSGEMDKSLLSHASKLLKKFGDTEKAYKNFLRITEVCEERLTKEQVDRLWTKAQKHYHDVVEKDPSYVAPDKYNSQERLFGDDKKEVTTEVVKSVLCKEGISLRYNEITGLAEISGMPSEYSVFNSANTLPVLVMDKLREKQMRTSRANIDDCLVVIADENRYNPVREMLSTVIYDGVDRLKVVGEILGIRSEREGVYLRKWLHQCVSMALNDDDNPYGADGVLVLQGVQGSGKTWFFSWLTGAPKLFAEGVCIDTDSKDSIIQATGVWIAELGELDSTLKREQSSLKAFITLRADTYRVPYGRVHIKKPRRTSFCGTVNPEEFLNDDTGSRRFWVVHIDHIDLDRMRSLSSEWVAQLWAQVYYELYQPNPQGFRLTPEERKELEEANRIYAKPTQGEMEVRDKLDFEAPYDHWKWRKISELMDELDITGVSSVVIGKVVSALASEDWRIKKKKSKNIRAYYLPPMIGWDKVEANPKQWADERFRVPEEPEN